MSLGGGRNWMVKKTDSLRERAEREVHKAKLNGHIPEINTELIHELRVHQVELEMQNEELKESHEELTSLYSQYYELYDTAPVGYFSIDKDLIIRNVNIKGAGLLGLSKEMIIGRGFSRFIPANKRDKYYNSLIEIASSGELDDVELQLKRNGTLFYADMRIMPVYENKEYRIVITDITERKEAEKS